MSQKQERGDNKTEMKNRRYYSHYGIYTDNGDFKGCKPLSPGSCQGFGSGEIFGQAEGSGFGFMNFFAEGKKTQYLECSSCEKNKECRQGQGASRNVIKQL